MDGFLNFLADNCMIFLIVSGVLLFALIGFVVMGKKKKAESENKVVANAETNNEAQSAPQVAPQMSEPVSTMQNNNVAVNPTSAAPTAPADMNANPVTPASNPMGGQTAPVNEPMPEEPKVSDEPTLIIPDPSNKN